MEGKIINLYLNAVSAEDLLASSLGAAYESIGLLLNK